MNKKLLLTTQRNALFQHAEKVGLNTSDFEWQEIKSPRRVPFIVSKLVHVPSGYYIIFDYNRDGKLVIHQSPSESSGFERLSSGDRRRIFTDPVRQGAEWMGYLKREIEVPDLWQTVTLEAEVIGFDPTSTENLPFTVEESEALETSLNELREYIATSYQLTGDRLNQLDANVEYLKKAISRLGKLDWKNIFISTIFNLGIRLGYDAGFIHGVFRFMGGLITSSSGLDSLSP